MKRYNIKPKKKEFKWGEMDVLFLGEKGRGRHYELIPYHAPLDAKLLGLATTRSGKLKIVNSRDDDKWLARINTSGTYTRNTAGSIVCSQPVREVASGWGAYGTAGRVGSWMDYLLVVDEGTIIKVKPSGGRSKIPAYYLHFGKEEVTRISDKEIDLFLDHNNIAEPVEWVYPQSDLTKVDQKLPLLEFKVTLEGDDIRLDVLRGHLTYLENGNEYIDYRVVKTGHFSRNAEVFRLGFNYDKE